MMKNNPVEKTVGKWKLWTAIVAVIMVVGIVIAAVFGFNTHVDLQSVKTVTVDYSDIYVEKVEDLEETCENSFDKSDVTPLKKTVSVKSNAEIIYYFDVDADLTEAVETLKEDIATATSSTLVKVSVHTEEFQQGLSEDYILRAAIAVGVFAVAAFVYVALRYKLSMGITLAASILAAAGMTVALVAIIRIPVAASFAYAVAFAVLVTAVMSIMTFNRLRDNAKDKDKQKDMTAQEKTVAAVPTKQILTLAVALTLAVGVLGAIVAVARWFAVTAFIGIVASVASAWIFAPALFALLDSVIKSSGKPLFKTKKKEKKVTEVVAAESKEVDAE
ncbi:MAG: hypothetical protein IJY11_00255 [Clostridia bacterium]|nr:hypothetical protein [Clostridia bacterium]